MTQFIDNTNQTVPIQTLETFEKIGKVLTSTLATNEVLRSLLHLISDLFRPTRWGLLLANSDLTQLHYEILINAPSTDRQLPISFGEGIAGWVAQNSHPFIWPGNHLPSPQHKLDHGTSLLCLPMQSKGKLLGVIELYRNHPSPIFTDNEINILATIADFTAIAIENARAYQKIEELTITDDLTGLYNSRQMHVLIDSELLRASRYHKDFSLIFFDLDGFKQVNDTWGHLSGSALLHEIGQILKSQMRDVDYAARYGGDEFVVLLPETSKQGAVRFAERVRSAIESHRFLKGNVVNATLTASFGVSNFPEDAKNKEELLSHADTAMYRAKQSSKNRVESFT